MLSSFLQFVAGYLTGGAVEDRENDQSVDMVSSETERNTEVTEKSDDLSSDNINDALEQTCHGTITSFFNNRGLIDDHIYFTQNIVIGSDQPKVGDNVLVKASRSHAAGGWVAESVQITSLWDVDEEDQCQKPQKDVIIGMIVKTFGNSIQIKTTVEFNVPLNKFKSGFKPHTGDWVSIEIWIDKNDSEFSSFIQIDKIISIAPLREKKIHGVVTDTFNHNGFINGDVYFPYAICKKGTFFKKGDNVVSLIIESKQKRGNWRAVYIEHSKKNKSCDKDKENDTVLGDNVKNDNDCLNGIKVTRELAFGDICCNKKNKMMISIR